jgi:ATP synthase I chain
MDPDRQFLERAVGRIWKAMFAISLGGVIVAFAWRGFAWAAGFALGSAVSWLNFRWLKQLVYTLGSDRARPRSAVKLGLRYLLLGVGAYVMLKYSWVSQPAALAGLFVSVAAVIVEILFELVYERKSPV